MGVGVWGASLRDKRAACAASPHRPSFAAKEENDVGWASGKHALITGGGSGIGAAAARMLAAEGARVSLLGRRPEPLEAVAAETGGKAFACDVTDRAALEAAFDAARAANGPFDYVILNAGIGDSAPFLRTSRARVRRDHRHQPHRGVRRRAARASRPARRRGQAPDHRRLGRGPAAAPLMPRPMSRRSMARSGWPKASRSNSPRPTSPSTPSARRSSTRRWSMNQRRADRRVTKRSDEEARAALAAMNANGRLVTAEEVASSIAQSVPPAQPLDQRRLRHHRRRHHAHDPRPRDLRADPLPLELRRRRRDDHARPARARRTR